MEANRGTYWHVEAYTASWIEIYILPSLWTIPQVEAYTASWIEMMLHRHPAGRSIVEAYTASWIEIVVALCGAMKNLSRLIQPRGLKFK